MKYDNTQIRQWIRASFFIIIGILLPMLFHSMGIAGKVFLPMHIPVLIAGFLLNPLQVVVVGVITPLASSILTGMPILYPIGLLMAIELGAYGLCIYFLNKKLKWSVLPTVIGSMLLGRVVLGVILLIMIQLLGVKLNAYLYLKGAILTGLPGILLQIILIPIILKRINTMTFMDKRMEI